MDVTDAFLNSDLNEEVYMASPPGVPHQPGEVSKLFAVSNRHLVLGMTSFPQLLLLLDFFSSHYDRIIC